jgi:tRNA G18 (ribose-2'-O)-methylase SpoU
MLPLLDMRDIVLIAHNLRSCHNVGSLLRTAEGLGVSKVYLTGYSPYPLMESDTRLPHIAHKLARQIHKTALGAESMVSWTYSATVSEVITGLQAEGYIVAALEQTDASLSLSGYDVPDKIALLVGREVDGVEPEVLAICDAALQIPMFGQKESFNVVQAAAMALYHCRFN